MITRSLAAVSHVRRWLLIPIPNFRVLWGFAAIGTAIVMVGVAARAADPPAPAAIPDDNPGADAAGAMPRHIPPMLMGRVRSLSPESSRLDVALGPRVAATVGPVSITVPSYTEINRIKMIQPAVLQHGDSVYVRGVYDPDTQRFQANSVMRLEHRVGLAPGIELAEAPVAPNGIGIAAGGKAGKLDVFGSLAANLNGQVTTSTVPGQGVGGKQPGKVAIQAQRFLNQAIQRGVLRGLVVSNNPLVVEAYTGQLFPIDPQPNATTLDQVRVKTDELKEGALVRINGSEIGPGLFRAGEIDILPPGLMQAFAGGPGRRQAPLFPPN